jgi:hypothetical protein
MGIGITEFTVVKYGVGFIATACDRVQILPFTHVTYTIIRTNRDIMQQKLFIKKKESTVLVRNKAFSLHSVSTSQSGVYSTKKMIFQTP